MCLRSSPVGGNRPTMHVAATCENSGLHAKTLHNRSDTRRADRPLSLSTPDTLLPHRPVSLTASLMVSVPSPIAKTPSFDLHSASPRATGGPMGGKGGRQRAVSWAGCRRARTGGRNPVGGDRRAAGDVRQGACGRRGGGTHRSTPSRFPMQVTQVRMCLCMLLRVANGRSQKAHKHGTRPWSRK